MKIDDAIRLNDSQINYLESLERTMRCKITIECMFERSDHDTYEAMQLWRNRNTKICGYSPVLSYPEDRTSMRDELIACRYEFYLGCLKYTRKKAIFLLCNRDFFVGEKTVRNALYYNGVDTEQKEINISYAKGLADRYPHMHWKELGSSFYSKAGELSKEQRKTTFKELVSARYYFYRCIKNYNHEDATFLICNTEFFISLCQLEKILNDNNGNYINHLIEYKATPQMLAKKFPGFNWRTR